MGVLREGQVLGAYTIRRILGQGGMGEVYEAYEEGLRRQVAIKLLPAWTSQDRDAVHRLLREARAASQIQHPGIVAIHALGESDGLHYIVMEYVEGETLAQRIAAGPLPLEETLRIGVQVAEALAAAHARGLVHRDIKPSNIAIARDGSAKVLDFGLAKRIGPVGDGQITTADLTRTGAVVGTVWYMSPEQARGAAADPRTDLFSLGAVLYEAATGRPPFRGPSALAILHEIATAEPLPPSLSRPELPAEFDRVIGRALAKDPARRHETASRMAEDLRSIVKLARPAAARHITSTGGAVQILPIPRTSFVGREQESRDVRNLLADSPLVTLTGPGGAGKTRLAIQIGWDVASSFASGVRFVDLSAVPEPGLIELAVAGALGVREVPGKPLGEAIHDSLRGQAILLILDNCEQLSAGVSAWTEKALGTSSGLRILVTSREPLGLGPERLFHVPPLAVPREDEIVSLSAEQAMGYEAVRLFAERAARVQLDFNVSDGLAPTIARICSKLDGIPLALELAAARVGVLPPSEILERLENRFRILTSRDESLPPRHRTLRAAIDWSYGLLADEERDLFDRLGVFAGSADLEAVENVCEGDGLPQSDILDLLSRLVDKSLVVVEEGRAAQARYRLMDSLREFTRDRLEARAMAARLRNRHADYCVRLAEKAEGFLEAAEQRPWLDRLENELENLRAAVHWLVERRDGARAVRLAGSLGRFCRIRGYWAEGSQWFEAALALPGSDADCAARAKALLYAGRLRAERGDHSGASGLYEASLEGSRAGGDRLGESMALANLGLSVQALGEYTRAREHFEEALRLQRALGNERAVAISYNNLARLSGEMGDLEAARAFFQEGLARRRAVNDHRGVAVSLNGLGATARYQGDYVAARAYLLEALAIERELDDKQGIAYSLATLGEVAMEQGNSTAARTHLSEAISVHHANGDRVGIAFALDAFAGLALAESRPPDALRLLAAARSLHRTSGTNRTPVERDLVESRQRNAEARLSREVAARAVAEGEVMGLDAALELALRVSRKSATP